MKFGSGTRLSITSINYKTGDSSIRQLEFLAQINFFQSGFSCFALVFFCPFKNLCLLSFKQFTVNCEIAKPFGFNAQNCSCPLDSQYFCIHSKLHHSTLLLKTKGFPYINWGFFGFVFFFSPLCCILVQWTIWYIQVSYITRNMMSHLLRTTIDWTGVSSDGEKCAVRKCF